MANPLTIGMVLSNIFEVFKDFSNRKPDENGSVALQVMADARDKFKTSNIAARANNNIAQFPILVSDSIPGNVYTMITRALEKNFAALLLIVMNQNNILDLDWKDKSDILSTVHTNPNSFLTTEEKDFITWDTKEFLKRNNTTLLKEVTEYEPLIHTKDCFGRIIEFLNEDDNNYSDDDLSQDEFDNKYRPYSPRNKSFTQMQDRYGNKHDIISNANLKTDMGSKILDMEIKKSNDLIPTIIEVSMMYKNQNFVDKIIFGVKALGHLVTANELTTNLISLIDNDRFFIKFIRWVTGEISFFKDFLFNIKNIKYDVKSSSKSKNGVNWFNWLKENVRKSYGSVLSGSKKRGLIPNSTIVISVDEADYIRSQTGADLQRDPKILSTVCQKLFLVAFVIVDVPLEMASFYFNDGTGSIKNYTFSMLEKEATNSQYKAMFDVMTRAQRL